ARVVVAIVAAIARNGTTKNGGRVGADAGEAAQLQLDKERCDFRLRGRGQALQQATYGPAAAVVLKARHDFNGAIVPGRVIVASHCRPAATEGPLPGNVDLAEHLARVTIAAIEHLADFRLIARHEVEALGLIVARVVLHAGV